MSYISFHFTNFLVDSSSSFSMNKEQSKFDDLFFSKFKNLLDDYISNYLVKYLFFFLFISFFYLEIGFFLFSMMDYCVHILPFIFDLENNILYATKTYCIAYLIDMSYLLSSFTVFEYIYSFLAFNLDVISLVVNSLGRFDYFMMTLLVLTFYMLFEVCTHENNVPVNTLVYMYLVFSIFIYILYAFGFLSLLSSTLLLSSFPLIISLLLSELCIAVFTVFFILFSITLSVIFLFSDFGSMIPVLFVDANLLNMCLFVRIPERSIFGKSIDFISSFAIYMYIYSSVLYSLGEMPGFSYLNLFLFMVVSTSMYMYFDFYKKK